jgi:hypothetical protein
MEWKRIENIRKRIRRRKRRIYLFIFGIFDDPVSISDSISTGVSCFPSVPPGKFLESTLKLIQGRFLQHSL